MIRKIVVLIFILLIFSSLSSALPTKVLLLKNRNAWSSTALESTLSSLGITYDVMNSDQFKQTSLDELLNNYYMIIIESDQDQKFYDTIIQERTKLEEFVKAGRFLHINACDHGWGRGVWKGTLPGGLTVIRRFSYYDYDVVNQRWLYSTYASHGYFANVPQDAEILAVQSTNQYSPTEPDYSKPTTVEFKFGKGMIYATMETFEYSVTYTYSRYRKIWRSLFSGTLDTNENEAMDVLNSVTVKVVKAVAPVPMGSVVLSAFLIIFVGLYLRRQ